MKRVLLLFTLFILGSRLYCQNFFNDVQWVPQIGLNAFDQKSNQETLVPKSALGFQIGLEAIKGQKFFYRTAIQYQYHEIFELKNRQSQVISNTEQSGKKFHRFQWAAGIGYHFVTFDFLRIGLSNSLAYHLNIYPKNKQFLQYYNDIQLDYISNNTELFLFIKHLKIGLSLEGNLISIDAQLDPYQSKTLALNFGYIF